MQKLKIGDKVKVLTGKDKGREGAIERWDPKKSMVLIPGINVFKKHTKGFGDQKAGIYDVPKMLLVSKVALICPKCKKVTRVTFKFVGEEKKRVCAKCKREIDTKEVTKKKKK